MSYDYNALDWRVVRAFKLPHAKVMKNGIWFRDNGLPRRRELPHRDPKLCIKQLMDHSFNISTDARGVWCDKLPISELEIFSDHGNKEQAVCCAILRATCVLLEGKEP